LDYSFNSFIGGLPLWIILLGAFLTAFLLTYFSIPPIVKVSTFKKLFALPNSRTSHLNPTPNMGGIAIFIGFVISVVIFYFPGEPYVLIYLLSGIIILLFIGLKDDILILDPKKKILGQFAASLLIVILGHQRITDFQNILGINELSYLSSVIFTVLLFVFIIISFNFIDGIDGLASGFGIIISLFYCIYFLKSGDIPSVVICVALAGALLAFFRFNVFSKTTKIFMGDAGAMITGLIIAVLTVRFIESGKDPGNSFHLTTVPAIAMGLLFIPLSDALRVLVLRIIDGLSLIKGDRNHVHHLALKLCDSHIWATLLVIVLNLIILSVSILFQSLGNVLLILLMTIISGLFYFGLWFLTRRKPDKFPHTDIDH
jgi:UDP-GlcNAc:undecaprenyl-phosphate/decaprenyl-phosphate GlcNAc-1-phosphate transferase